MTKIIFSVMFPLLQILYQVKVPLKIGCCKKKKKTFTLLIFSQNNYFMSSSSLSERGKPRFSSYLKLQNVSLIW